MEMLRVASLWVGLAIVVVLDVVCIAILYLGRYYFEGKAYNVAWSSKFGDQALVGIILIAFLTLREMPKLDGFFTKPSFQTACLVASIGIGLIVQWLDWSKRDTMVMDIYHNIFIVPLFLFLLALSFSIIFTNGSKAKIGIVLGLLVFWAVLVVLDITAKPVNRMDQQAYLKYHGFTSPAWK